MTSQQRVHALLAHGLDEEAVAAILDVELADIQRAQQDDSYEDMEANGTTEGNEVGSVVHDRSGAAVATGDEIVGGTITMMVPAGKKLKAKFAGTGNYEIRSTAEYVLS
jgi:hypothetical protein